MWLVYSFWFIVVVYLTISAMGVKQETEPHLLQSFGLLFAIIVAFLLPRLSIFHFLNFAPLNPLLSSIGVILCAAGMVVLVRARHRLGGNWSQTVAVKKGHELVTSGPYRYVRHPMYAGGLLACIGSAIVCGGAASHKKTQLVSGWVLISHFDSRFCQGASALWFVLP